MLLFGLSLARASTSFELPCTRRERKLATHERCALPRPLQRRGGRGEAGARTGRCGRPHHKRSMRAKSSAPAADDAPACGAG
eukprot:4824669-Prymnesium_polylepis.1